MKLAFAISLAIAFPQLSDAAEVSEDTLSLGVRIEAAKDIIVTAEGHEVRVPQAGVYVLSANRYGSLGAAGLRRFDVVTSCNGKRVSTVDEFLAELHKQKVGDAFKLQIERPTFVGRGARWSPQQINGKMVSSRHAALSSLETDDDEFRGIRFLWHADTAQSPSEKSQLALYLSESKGGRLAFLRFQILTSDLFHFNQIAVKVDDQKLVISPRDPTKVHFDFSGIDQWYAWYDHPVDEAEAAMIERMAAARAVTIRFEDAEYYRDFAVPLSQVDQVTSIWEANGFLNRTATPKLIATPDGPNVVNQATPRTVPTATGTVSPDTPSSTAAPAPRVPLLRPTNPNMLTTKTIHRLRR